MAFGDPSRVAPAVCRLEARATKFLGQHDLWQLGKVGDFRLGRPAVDTGFVAFHLTGCDQEPRSGASGALVQADSLGAATGHRSSAMSRATAPSSGWRPCAWRRHRCDPCGGGAQALGVSPVTVKRWVQAYREHGTEGLDRMRAPRQHRVLDSERHRTADLLHVGRSLRSVALALDVNREAQHQ